MAYLVNNKHGNEDDIIVEGEFPILSNPGCPPDDSSKEETHKHPRQIGLCQHIKRTWTSSETTVGVCAHVCVYDNYYVCSKPQEASHTL